MKDALTRIYQQVRTKFAAAPSYLGSASSILDASTGEVNPARLAQFQDYKPEAPGHGEVFFRDVQKLFEPIEEDNRHIGAAVEWLLNAQRETGTPGFSVGYSFSEGWLPPYPETTGYIITTLWDVYHDRGDVELRDSALAAATWEADIQLESGAIQAGYYGSDPSGFWDGSIVPAAFNTGQVILGWNRTFEETGELRFLEAAVRASEFLVGCIDDQGIFRKGLSPGPTNPVRSYYTRVAHALAWTGALAHREGFIAAARRHLDWVLTQQKENGWFRNAQFHAGDNPLTHNMAYVAEGLLDAGLLLKDEGYVRASQRHVVEVMNNCERRGFFLPATLDENWKSTDGYSCVTGNAQFAALWLRHGELAEDLPLVNAGLKMVDWLKGIHSLENENPGIRGGLAGAWPIDGGYSIFRYLNWPTKFFIDALLLGKRAKARLLTHA